jgi:hypothetical protein
MSFEPPDPLEKVRVYSLSLKQSRSSTYLVLWCLDLTVHLGWLAVSYALGTVPLTTRNFFDSFWSHSLPQRLLRTLLDAFTRWYAYWGFACRMARSVETWSSFKFLPMRLSNQPQIYGTSPPPKSGNRRHTTTTSSSRCHSVLLLAAGSGYNHIAFCPRNGNRVHRNIPLYICTHLTFQPRRFTAVPSARSAIRRNSEVLSPWLYFSSFLHPLPSSSTLHHHPLLIHFAFNSFVGIYRASKALVNSLKLSTHLV